MFNYFAANSPLFFFRVSFSLWTLAEATLARLICFANQEANNGSVYSWHPVCCSGFTIRVHHCLTNCVKHTRGFSESWTQLRAIYEYKLQFAFTFKKAKEATNRNAFFCVVCSVGWVDFIFVVNLIFAVLSFIRGSSLAALHAHATLSQSIN